MWLTRLKDKGIASFNGCFTLGVSNEAIARYDVIKFLLRTVRMVGVALLAGRDKADLHVEWIPLAKVGRGRLPPQGLGNFLASTGRFPSGDDQASADM